MDKGNDESGKEDGHTQIPNQIIEALMRTNLSAYETRILFLIIRQTLGWNKKEDQISFSQMAKKTGLDRRLAARAMKGLIYRKIVIKRDDSYINKYRFNKNFETWKDVIPKDTSVYSDDRMSSKSMTKLSSIETPTKDNKDTLTKDMSDVDIFLTDILIEKLLENDPKAKVPEMGTKQFFTWVNHIRLCRERDKRSPEEIENGITFSQGDSFWKGNILSPEKLRIKLPTLLLKAKEEVGDRSVDQVGKSPPSVDPTLPDSEWQRIAGYLYKSGKSERDVSGFYVKQKRLFPKIEDKLNRSDKEPGTFIGLLNGAKA